MAHLLHNPFQKPFEFPRQGPLLTPPETEPEHQTQHQTVPLPSTNGLGIELEPAPTHRSISVTEVPISRRMQYIQSGPREARERTVHRSVRWLVVVTPPLSFSQEHGSFGHNLSVGSPERLSQGILMPLLQTMSSQLSAIAREFAFPSTAGLCLYLHTSHGGISITPRITDESWPLLWAHLFEPRSPTASTSAPQLPIGGRIEFDIDPTKARWLDAWLGLLRRENLDVPVSAAPSRRGSLSHFREDSRTSFHDDRTEEPLDGAPVILPPRPSRIPGHRHVPRKLSLLDRLESASARSGSRLATRTANSPSPPAFLDAPQRPSIGLSPIVQEDEPKTAQKDIDVFVNSWRASASIAVPSPFHATGQTSLDPVNLPNNIEITGDDEDVRSELDLNDFQWSVSSVGPPEYDAYDYEDDDFDTESWRLPSVHMDRRGEGSVCLTPTTCTSWGPSDFDLELDAHGLYEAHFAALAMEPTYSPDIATRMLEDCPPTPSTATSWGPPLSWPPSPVRSELSYVGSVDLGQRCMSEVPLTPSTATSWGPPLEWPPSPVRSELSYVGSVDLGQRAMSEVPLTPSTATSWGPPLSYPPSPATPYHVHSPDIGQRTFDIEVPRLAPAPRPRRLDADAEVGEGEGEVAEPWRNVWPYVSTTSASAEASPYTFVFPQRPSTPPPLSPSEPTTLQPTQTQQAAPFAFGWPFFDVSTEATPAPAGVQAPPEHSVEPVDHELEDVDVEEQTQKPRVKKISPFTVVFEDDAPVPVVATAASRAGEEEDAPASHVWPYFDASNAVEAEASVQPGPSNHLATSEPSTTTSREVTNAPEHAVPWNHVWPYTEDELAPFRALSHIWPYSALFDTNAPVPDGPWNFVWPYPKLVYNGLLMKDDSKASVDYPFFNLYPAVYPQFELYPEVTGTLHHRAPTKLVVELEATYPAVQPYRSVYPHLEIYPGAPMSNVYTNVVVSLSPEERSYYPAIDLYGPVYPSDVQMYPWNLYNLYPASKRASKVDVDGPFYPSDVQVYPWNVYNLYSAVNSASKRDVDGPVHSSDVQVYPWNVYNLYPAVNGASKPQQQLASLPVLTLTPGYPTLNLYAPVYPYNLDNIYPPVKADIEGVTWTDTLSTRLEAVYPAVQIYAPVYPHNVENIYPAVKVEKAIEASSKPSGALKALEIRLPTAYPNLMLYSPVYPHNVMEIYPAVVASSRKSSINGLEPIVVRLSASYPTLDIYPVGYPWSLSNIYPSIVAETLSRIVVLEHKTEYPHIQPYQPVYPYNVEAIYPAVTVTVEEKRPVRSGTRHKNPVHRTQHSHHAKRSLSTSKAHVPPVPPLPQNVQSWRPINPTSRAPLSGKRVYVGLPVQLAPQYPRICPYPSVYPHLEIYPELPAENVVRPIAPRRKAKRSHFQLHQLVFASTSGFAPRRKPKFTHLQLHEKIFGPLVSPPTSPRRLPVPPQIAVPPRPALSIVEPTSAVSQSPSSASPSTRARSGTVSQRPVLPTPPPPQADSPPKVTRRLPSIPQNGSPRGLPSDPAMIRRTSMMPVVNKSPSFSPLSTVPEPSELHPEPLSSSPTRRPLPQPRPYASPAPPDSPVLPRSARPMSTLPPPLSNNTASLSRSNTLPQRPTPRSRRGTLTTGPSGIVAGLTKAFDSNDVQVPPPPSLSSTLSQFPTPPRPPLPPIPGGRPVSKLDRSRYPYN